MRKAMLTVAIVAAVGASAWAMATNGRNDEQPSVRERLSEMADVNAYDAKYDARVAKQDARAEATLDVGDADSFGRNARWLGLVSSSSISLRTSCEPEPGEAPDPLCSVVDPASTGTHFVQYRDIARMTLPARSTNSFLCHWLTPTVGVSFANYSGVDDRNARLTLYPSLTVENAALNAVGLVDPVTGAPLNGKLEIVLSSAWNTALLDNGEYTSQRNMATRACIGGYISKRQLREYYGLSDQQVQQFFGGPTTIRLNVDVRAQHVASAGMNYSIRFLGD